MRFRKYIESERNKRIAHIDLHAQLERQPLGAFPEGADQQFLEDLQEFVTIANQYLNPGVHLSITVPDSDTFKLVRALEKSVVFDAVPNATRANGPPLFSIMRQNHHNTIRE